MAETDKIAMNVNPLVFLSKRLTQIRMDVSERTEAVTAAYYVTASTCEWTWTIDQQVKMARYCLWAAQRLAVIESLVLGVPLTHEVED